MVWCCGKGEEGGVASGRWGGEEELGLAGAGSLVIVGDGKRCFGARVILEFSFGVHWKYSEATSLILLVYVTCCDRSYVYCLFPSL